MRLSIPFISLRIKLVALSFLVLLPAVVMVIVDSRHDYQTALDHALDFESDKARTIGTLVDGVLDSIIDVDTALSTGLASTYEDAALVEAALHHLLVRCLQCASLSYYDWRSDRVVASATKPNVSAPNPDDPGLRKRVAETWQPVVSNAMPVQPTGQPGVLVAVPVFNDQGVLVGALETGLDLGYLGGQLTDIGRSTGQSVFLTDPTGRIVFHSDRPAFGWDERDVSNWQPVAVALRGENARVPEDRSPVMQGIRTMAASPTARYGWVAAVSMPRDRVVQSVQESLQLNAGWLALSLALAAVLSLGLSGLVIRPLNELRLAWIDVQHGRLRRVALPTRDELETLGHCFNQAVDKLERTTVERAEHDQLREEFISMVAHDLRTPLTVILGYAGVLKRSLDERTGERTTEEKERKALEHLYSSARRLNAMVGDLLDASRIESNRLMLEKERVDLRCLVPEVVERLEEVTRGHIVRLIVEPDPMPVMADPRRVEQILGNLLSNAAKYGYPGTEITVRLWTEDVQACCSVADHGPGIAPEERAHLFERYYRGARNRERHGGLGLGLYITRGLVESHGGRIWVDAAVGEGSTFAFCLPLAGG